MTNKTQNILILLTMAVLIGLIVVWFYVLNKGELIINTGVDDYRIYAETEEMICPQDPCTLKLKIGTHQIRFEKEGYNTITSVTTILRGKTSALQIEARKKMEIKPSSFLPAEYTPEPSVSDADNIIAYSWNTKRDRLLFLDSGDDRLKIREPDGKITLITALKNILPPMAFYWSPDEKRILASQKADLYFIEIDMGSRKKQVLDFTPTGITWSPASDFIALNDEKHSLYKIEWENTEDVKKMDVELGLEKSAWISDTTLLAYTMDEKINQTEIWSFDLTDLTKEILAKKFDFLIDKMIYDPDKNTVYFRHEREGTWHEMQM
jgi:dipeptidyl aminopeptidase/acylaminoacyl peptidase